MGQATASIPAAFHVLWPCSKAQKSGGLGGKLEAGQKTKTLDVRRRTARHDEPILNVLFPHCPERGSLASCPAALVPIYSALPFWFSFVLFLQPHRRFP